MGGRRPSLLAYLHLRAGSGRRTKDALEAHVRAFAAREGYDLIHVAVGREPTSADSLGSSAVNSNAGTVSEAAVVELVRETGAAAVLVVGPATQAFVALHRMPEVRVLTLADVRPMPAPGSDAAVAPRRPRRKR